MSPQALADAVLIVHVLFVATVVLLAPLVILGGICGWRWVRNPWVRFTHLGMIGFVVMETLMGMDCPLTLWESNLRGAGNGYGREGFIAAWLDRLLFHPFPHWVFTAIYVGYGLLVASLFYFVPVKFRGRNSK